MGIIFLFVAILCTSLFAVIFKICQQRGVEVMPVILFNYITAALISVVSVAVNITVTSAPVESCLLPPVSIVLALVQGAVFVAGFSMMNWATLRSGVALTTVSARASLVVPVLLSWLILNQPQPAWIPTALIIIAMTLIVMPVGDNGKQQNSDSQGVMTKTSAAIALAGVFIIYGVSDFSFKLIQDSIEKTFADNDLEIHLSSLTCMMFLMSSLLALVICLMKGSLHRNRISWKSVGWGFLLGLVNLGCASSVLRALGEMSTGVFYPVYNAGIVMMATLIGVLFFKERIKPWQYVGLLLAVVAIVLFTYSSI